MAGKGITVKKNWDNPIEHAMPEGVRVPAEMRIGPVLVAPATVLAPMAGVTDTVFRRFIRHASVFSSAGEAGSQGKPVSQVPKREGPGAPSVFSSAGEAGSQGKPVSQVPKREGPGAPSVFSSAGEAGSQGKLASQVPRREGPGAPEIAAPEIAAVEAEVSNRQSGCGLLMTEFTSADGLSRMRESKRRRYLTFYDDEHPIGAQLFGSNAETLAEAARIVEDTGFDTVDLNLGCPAKRVVGCNGGSGLLRDLPKIGEIFRVVRKAVTIPFTVKFRLGWNDSQIVCVELARMAEAEGLNAVALHARTREQGYSGQARWEWIAAIKQAVGIPVIGNGDIRTPEDAAAMVAQTGCDGVMIGRAAAGNPWIFRQIAQYTATGSYDLPTFDDRYHMIRAYFEMLLAEAEATKDLPRDARIGDVAGKMKQFATWFTHGVPGGARLRKSIYQARTGVEVLDRVNEFFAAGPTLPNGPDDRDGNGSFPEAALVCD